MLAGQGTLGSLTWAKHGAKGFLPISVSEHLDAKLLTNRCHLDDSRRRCFGIGVWLRGVVAERARFSPPHTPPNPSLNRDRRVERLTWLADERDRMHAVPLRLAPGSDLRRALEEFARDRAASGFVMGVVGDLSRAAFQCPGQAGPTLIDGDLEIITLNGTLSPEGVHLHLSLSDGACQVWGGHLEHGSLVRKGADVLLGLFASEADDGSTPSGGAARAPREPVVEIAVSPRCPFSARAQRLLRTLGIPHQVIEVHTPEDRAEVEQRSGRPTLPQVFIDGEAIGGYDALAELHGRGALDAFRAY